MTFLTSENVLTDSPEGDTTGTDSEADSTADGDSDSESELWRQFDFPQLTSEEDAQLTIALQGGTPQLASSIETSTAMVHHGVMEDSSHICSGVLSPTVRGSSEISASGPPYSPPPYISVMSEFSNNAQPVNHNFLVGGDAHAVPISSTDRLFYILIDGVYHVFRQI